LDPEEPLVLNVLGQAKVVLHATTLSVTTLFLNLLSAKHEMPFMLLYLLTASNIAAPSSTEEFLGTMAFYRDAKYGHHLGTLKVDVANRCYNLDCSHLNNNVASVTWTGLPLDATYDDETSAQVAFYADKDCTGSSQHFQTRWGGVSSLSPTGLNDVVSSFMILQSSTGIENGIHSICGLGA
jgi:hypothetical protein